METVSLLIRFLWQRREGLKIQTGALPSNQKLVQWHLGATGLRVELFHVHQCSAPASTGYVSAKGKSRGVTPLDFIQDPFFTRQ